MSQMIRLSSGTRVGYETAEVLAAVASVVGGRRMHELQIDVESLYAVGDPVIEKSGTLKATRRPTNGEGPASYRVDYSVEDDGLHLRIDGGHLYGPGEVAEILEASRERLRAGSPRFRTIKRLQV